MCTDYLDFPVQYSVRTGSCVTDSFCSPQRTKSGYDIKTTKDHEYVNSSGGSKDQDPLNCSKALSRCQVIEHES